MSGWPPSKPIADSMEELVAAVALAGVERVDGVKVKFMGWSVDAVAHIVEIFSAESADGSTVLDVGVFLDEVGADLPDSARVQIVCKDLGLEFGTYGGKLLRSAFLEQVSKHCRRGQLQWRPWLNGMTPLHCRKSSVNMLVPMAS